MTYQMAVGLFKELAVGIAAIVGAVVAWRGLRTWQAQLKGKTEYEVARRVLRGVLAVRDAVSGVRGPFISSGEFAEAYRAAGKEPPSMPDAEGDALVYQRRWEPLRKARADLHVDLLEAEAIWGGDVPRLEARLNERCGELFAAVQMHLMERARPPRDDPKAYQRQEERMRVLYQASDDPKKDPFLAGLLEAVASFESFFRPKLAFR